MRETKFICFSCLIYIHDCQKKRLQITGKNFKKFQGGGEIFLGGHNIYPCNGDRDETVPVPDGTTCYLNRPNLLSMVPKVLNEAVLGAEDGPLHQLDRAFAAHVLL